MSQQAIQMVTKCANMLIQGEVSIKDKDFQLYSNGLYRDFVENVYFEEMDFLGSCMPLVPKLISVYAKYKDNPLALSLKAKFETILELYNAIIWRNAVKQARLNMCYICWDTSILKQKKAYQDNSYICYMKNKSYYNV